MLTDDEIKAIDWMQGGLHFARAIESAVLEKLKAQEPFGYYENGRFSITVDGGPDKWRERKAYRGAIYTHPLPPADVVRDPRVAELEAVLRECRDHLSDTVIHINGAEYETPLLQASEAIAKIDEVLNGPSSI